MPLYTVMTEDGLLSAQQRDVIAAERIPPITAALRDRRDCESREYSQEYSHDEWAGGGHHIG
jgi:hypothetical protein